MPRPKKPPTFECVNAGCSNRTKGELICQDCFAKTQPFRIEDEMTPRQGADRRRAGRGLRAE